MQTLSRVIQGWDRAVSTRPMMGAIKNTNRLWCGRVPGAAVILCHQLHLFSKELLFMFLIWNKSVFFCPLGLSPGETDGSNFTSTTCFCYFSSPMASPRCFLFYLIHHSLQWMNYWYGFIIFVWTEAYIQRLSVNGCLHRHRYKRRKCDGTVEAVVIKATIVMLYMWSPVVVPVVLHDLTSLLRNTCFLAWTIFPPLDLSPVCVISYQVRRHLLQCWYYDFFSAVRRRSFSCTKLNWYATKLHIWLHISCKIWFRRWSAAN